MHNWDISILKDFPFRERIRLPFRAEMFNAFNDVNFAASARSPPPERARIMQFGLKLFY